MLPLKDENPTVRKPIITLIIIGGCIAAFFGPQRGVSDQQQALEFNLEWAAIPCEIRTGVPLSEQEVVETFSGGDPDACADGTDGSPTLFPDKIVLLGMVTSMFLHGSLLHLGGNMWIFWIFGNNVEDRLGHLRFAVFYLIGGLAATLAHFAVQPTSTIPIVGASGAIAAIMGAYAVWYPNAPVRTLVFFFVRDISAKWFLGFWLVSQFFIGNDSGVAWMAHVGGFVFGAVIGLIIRGTSFAARALNSGPESDEWDYTGGAGAGPYPHLFEQRRGKRFDRR